MSSQSRHVYTHEERTILEASYARHSHPDINEKERLAKLLNCNIIQISNWFQNHRRRMKKQTRFVASNRSTSVSNVSVNFPVYQTSYVYHQPNCPFNGHIDNSSCYYYPSTSAYIYTQEPFYTQTMFVDRPFVYE